ncbi:type VI secretion system domain-containing protein, partial [Rubrivirga sp.]|uniref:type VI secretion system domain-containing protein n=1 Tax=Rubrivirga sp. TaxID=1885344 RepID=UPI003C77926F
PALPTLSFLGGTPFADPLTIAWLDKIASSDEGGGGGGGGLSPATEEAVKDAREKASGGDVPGAVSALMAEAGAPRDRFERTVTAAELCLGSGRPDVALGLLDGADEAIRLHRLDVWDPATASRALRTLYTCSSALLATAKTPERAQALSAQADDAFARLTRLDPAHAMRSTKAPA